MIDLREVGAEFEFDFFMQPTNRHVKRFAETVNARVRASCDSLSFKAGIEPYTTTESIHKLVLHPNMPTIKIRDPVIQIHQKLKVEVHNNQVGKWAAKVFNFVDKWLGKYLRPFLQGLMVDGLMEVETIVPKLLYFNVRNMARSVDHAFEKATGKDLNSQRNIKLIDSHMDLMPGQMFLAANIDIDSTDIV